MRKKYIISLLSLMLCLPMAAQDNAAVKKNITEYSQKAGGALKDVLLDLGRHVRSNKNLTVALQGFIKEYQPGSAKFDNAVRAIAHSDILPSILAAGKSSKTGTDILDPLLDMFEEDNTVIGNKKIRSLYNSSKEFLAKAIRANPSLYSQMKSVMDGSKAYERATADLLARLLPENLSENERACADILLNYYSYLAAGGSSSSLSEKDMETIKQAFRILAKHGGGSPFGLSLDLIMAKLDEVFPWFTNVSWLIPSQK